eukprot:9038523-Pyramimonas_sp.AAC.1
MTRIDLDRILRSCSRRSRSRFGDLDLDRIGPSRGLVDLPADRLIDDRRAAVRYVCLGHVAPDGSMEISGFPR